MPGPALGTELQGCSRRESRGLAQSLCERTLPGALPRSPSLLRGFLSKTHGYHSFPESGLRLIGLLLLISETHLGSPEPKTDLEKQKASPLASRRGRDTSVVLIVFQRSPRPTHPPGIRPRLSFSWDHSFVWLFPLYPASDPYRFSEEHFHNKPQASDSDSRDPNM